MSAPTQVSAVLVSHDGARWLPGVLDALEASTRQPDRVMAVDTGSTDGSVALVAAALGADPLPLPPATGYGDAVRRALEALPPVATTPADEWVWLLHDDSAPQAGCLAELIETLGELPDDVVAVGPTLREWPSLKRLLEVGVTISGSGRRETGLESGEYDQGQHDEPRAVLAVNTAGLLIRRDVLEEFGLDEALPLFGNDLDLGWRLARAGHGVQVVPAAVMFHAEAAHRGRRSGDLAARPRRGERAAAMHTLLANSTGAMVPVRWIRLLVGGLLRALGFLLVRDGGAARDELAAVLDVHGRPARLLKARSARRSRVSAPQSKVRGLLAPAWMPLRHLTDFLVDLARAVGASILDFLRAKGGPAGHTSLGHRMAASPTFWSLVATVVLALVASHGLLTGDPIHGGALLAAPDSVGHWWSTWASSWHWAGLGSDAPGPAYLLPMAVLGTLLLGQPSWVVWLLFVLTVPLAFVGADRFLRRIVPGRWAAPFGGLAYAGLPVLMGAVSQGRLGTVAASVLLPWVALSAMQLADPLNDRRARSTWRTALAAALLVMFVPAAWLLIALLLLAAPLLGARLRPWQYAALLVAPLVTLLPWLLSVLTSPGLLLAEAGRVGAVPVDPSVWEALAGRSGGPGSAPWWWGLGIPVAALLALWRADTRERVAKAWLVAAVGAIVLAALSFVTISAPGLGESIRPWAGFWILAVQAALVVAVVIAADGLVGLVSRESFGLGHVIAALAAVAALGGLVLGGFWWVAEGTQQPLARGPVAVAPAYMSELAKSRPDGATLVVTGGPRQGESSAVSYRVLRSDSLRLGDDGVLALTAPDADFDATMGDLLSGRSEKAAGRLAHYGIAYLYAPSPVSDQVAAAFDASNGLTSASAPDPKARAWRVVPTQDLSAIDRPAHPLRWLLSAVQVIALLGLVVLAAPSRPGRTAPAGTRTSSGGRRIA